MRFHFSGVAGAAALAIIMVPMSTWVTSVLLPVGLSVATTIVTGLTVGPRLTARAKRLQTAYDNRDRFGESVLTILALCVNLERFIIPPEVDDAVRTKLEGERDRWIDEIDDATIWLVDHIHLTALGYVRFSDLVGGYASHARGVWLSDRPVEERARALRELTEPVQTIYFTRRWRVVRTLPGEIDRLRAMLDLNDSSG